MLGDSSTCEVTAYVEEKLSSSSSSSHGAQCDLERGSYLVAIGNHQEAVRYLEAAHGALRDMQFDPFLERLFFKTCILYAWCLDCMGDFNKEEELLLEALPGKGSALGDYAYFLHKRKSDYDLAQRYYKLSLSEHPKQSTVHLRYAGFLRHVRRDNVDAEKHYKLAAESNPQNSDAVGSYASFLHGVSRNYDSAEYYYGKAVTIDSTHINNFCNFGLFLSEERTDYIRAESMYRHALSISPLHANTLYNFAVMLDTHCSRKDEAEELYRQAIAVETHHTYALYNLAVLLEEKLRTLRSAGAEVDSSLQDEIRAFYHRAHECDPRDATALADYGRYILSEFKDVTNATLLLNKALALDPQSEVAMYSLALLNFRNKKDLLTAETILRDLLQLNPNHVSGMHQLAQVLLEMSKKPGKPSIPSKGQGPIDEAFQLLRHACKASKDPSKILTEYCSAVNHFGSNRDKLSAVEFCDSYFKIGMTKDVPLEDVVEKIQSSLR